MVSSGGARISLSQGSVLSREYFPSSLHCFFKAYYLFLFLVYSVFLALCTRLNWLSVGFQAHKQISYCILSRVTTLAYRWHHGSTHLRRCQTWHSQIMSTIGNKVTVRTPHPTWVFYIAESHSSIHLMELTANFMQIFIYKIKYAVDALPMPTADPVWR